MILSTVVRLLWPLLLLFAAFLFLKGHNAPGGGFIAGLLTAVAVVLRYLSDGRDPLTVDSPVFTYVIAGGLGIAALTAFAPTVLGYEFFTHTFGFVDVPLLGKIELATASLFDLGVYVVVVGNVVTVIRAMTDQR